jgi:hypothetical protein
MGEKKRKNLKPTKSSGQDVPHPRVLQETESTIGLPLSLIFKNSLAEEPTPGSLEDRQHYTIHKKGKKTVPGNYRHVSLTSVVSKVMESLVRVGFVSTHDYFCDAQHGFSQGGPAGPSSW